MLLENLETVLKRLATSAGPNRGPTEDKASFHH
jgi:hypothetical protein